jgi:hypothetical protein
LSSKVDICNAALSRIGQATITSLTDGTQPAKLCNTFFDLVARRVMTNGSWTSAIRRVTLAKTTNTPAFGFNNEFQLPVDPKCLKVLNVDEDIDGALNYAIEGDKLLTDEGTIKIRYIAELTDSEDYDVMLEEAIEIMLASKLAFRLVGDKQVALELLKEYEVFLANNLAIDNQQGSQQTYLSYDAIEVRR